MTDHSIFKQVKLLLLDVDGVLTEGEIIYGDDVEIKKFSVKDGLGIRLLMGAGIKVGIVTARKSEALIKRCKDLGIDMVFDGVSDKGKVLDKICLETGIKPDHIAFMGDDLPDIPLLRRVGIPLTVANGAEEVKRVAVAESSKNGGKGAVREICEAIMKSQNIWDKAVEKFYA